MRPFLLFVLLLLLSYVCTAPQVTSIKGTSTQKGSDNITACVRACVRACMHACVFERERERESARRSRITTEIFHIFAP